LAAEIESRRWRRPGVGGVVARHLGVGEGEVDVVAAIDGEIIDPALLDGVG
jgi:hypothetical protein